MLFKCTLERWPKVDKQVKTGHHLCPNHLLYSRGYSIKMQLPVYIYSVYCPELTIQSEVLGWTQVLTLAYTLSKNVHNHYTALRWATGWQGSAAWGQLCPKTSAPTGSGDHKGQKVLAWNIISWICFQPQRVLNVLVLCVKIKNSWAACSCVTQGSDLITTQSTKQDRAGGVLG